MLVAAPAALAAAGGGSSGFSDGGGGGGGGGNGFALFIIFELLIRIAVIGHGLGALFLVACGLLYLFVTKLLPKLVDWWAARRAARGLSRSAGGPPSASAASSWRPPRRPMRIPAYAADQIVDERRPSCSPRSSTPGTRATAGSCATLAAPDLMVEWDRRLDDFDRRGWRNQLRDARASRRSSSSD